MKKCFILLILLCICSCAQQSPVRKAKIPPPSPIPEIPIQTMGKPLLPTQESITSLYGNLLSKINVSKSSFNPSQGEEVAIYYTLSEPAKVTVNIYDPDQGFIRALISEESIKQGDQTIIWDGKDMDGKVVPNESYFFTIIGEDEKGSKEIYDPTTFSGGVGQDITAADINPQDQTITYKMPEMGRVMIRMGIQGGPLLNTLVDWEPRTNGVVTEYWNGKDTDNLIDLYNHPKFKMIISYFTLPENSVITYGNKTMVYREYKKSHTVDRPKNPERTTSILKSSPHYRLPRTEDYVPDIKMDFVNTQGTNNDGNVILKGKTLVKVDLDEKDKVLFKNQQFEIVFFLDHNFYAEDETGYAPFNWVWDLSNVNEGEHIFTVNLSSFKDQVGVLSLKVRVIK